MILKDASNFQGEAQEILFPSSEAEIPQILREANKKKIPLTIAGAGTGLTGAGVPQGGMVLSTERLNRILKIHWDERTEEGWVVVQPGVCLEELEQALDPKNLFYPPDPGETKAFLGGTVATNASGPRSLRYGPTRGWVRRLKVLLANGETLECRRGQGKAKRGILEIALLNGKKAKIPIPTYPMPQVKSSAGYYAKPDMDLLDLFIGSEGTLGVFTELELEVLKKPELTLSGFLFFESEKKSYRFAQEALRFQPRALEFFDSRSLRLLCERHPEIPSGAGAALFFEEECRAKELGAARKRWTEDLPLDGRLKEAWLSHDPKENKVYRQLRHDLPALVNERVSARGFRKIGTDMAVPQPKAKEMFDFYLKELQGSGLDFCLFGHLGENHLHANILPESQEEVDRGKALYRLFAEKAISLGGTISAEHGIGKVRIPYLELMVGKEGLRQMARVKSILDPNGILSPGNIFPAELLKSPFQNLA